METAKANGLTPFEYVLHLLAQIAIQNTDVEKLLPWRFI
ncbi:transposase domain-containing protein [Glaciecola siphonariae]|uniref:Transposase domain-containing protein n=1 Tax=Glaciecola siphonariae TaxID=521012 RepID=A0ABV9LSD4_9ALTE